MQLIFRAYAKNTTTLLGTLSAAFDKRIRVHHNGPGEGAFSINRHESQAAWCVPDNYIRAYLNSVSNPPIFGFFIGSGEDITVSDNEEGGEILTRAGPGALSILSEAIIDPTSANFRYKNDGNWHWTDKTMGLIVKELIDDAQARSALSLVSYDFTSSLDSDGASWDTFDGEFELSVGMQIDEAVARLQSAGFIARMSPAFLLQAYKTLGTDRSASVTFARGTNITSDAQREVYASAAKSRMLVQGTSRAGVLKFAWATDAGVETALGRRKEGFVPYQSSASDTVLGRVGTQAINRLKKRHDGLSQIGVLETVKVPFTDYFPGDTVNVNIPGEYSNVHVPVTAIGIFDMSNGDAGAVGEFEDIAFERLQLNDRSDPTQASISGGLIDGIPGVGGSGTCPPCVSAMAAPADIIYAGQHFNITSTEGNRDSWIDPGFAYGDAQVFRIGFMASATGGSQQVGIGLTIYDGLGINQHSIWTTGLVIGPTNTTLGVQIDGGTTVSYSLSSSDLRDKWIWLEVRISNTYTTLEAKAWLDGDPPPLLYQVSRTQSISGSSTFPRWILLRTSRSGTSTSVDGKYRRVEAIGYNPETFHRVESQVWGTSEFALYPAWNIFPDPDAHYKVGPLANAAILAGQPVPRTAIAQGDGATLDFTTPVPYQANSLEIDVDGVPKPDAETDPTLGTLHLFAAPDSDETVFARWIAA